MICTHMRAHDVISFGRSRSARAREWRKLRITKNIAFLRHVAARPFIGGQLLHAGCIHIGWTLLKPKRVMPFANI